MMKPLHDMPEPERWLHITYEFADLRKDVSAVQKTQSRRNAVELSMLGAVGLYLLPKFIEFLIASAAAVQ